MTKAYDGRTRHEARPPLARRLVCLWLAHSLIVLSFSPALAEENPGGTPAASARPTFAVPEIGGLTPETVGAVIEQVRPWGVDVASGVERGKGIKDHDRVRAFVEAVRAEDRRST